MNFTYFIVNQGYHFFIWIVFSYSLSPTLTVCLHISYFWLTFILFLVETIMESHEDMPKVAQGAVLVESDDMPEGTPIVEGFFLFF